jgi:hypothetical protein
MRDPRRTLGAAILTLQAFVVFFAGLVAKDTSSLSTSAAITVFSALAMLCIGVAGMLRSPRGYALGWALQIVTIATGYWVAEMYFIGAIFAALWWSALNAGARIERERAELESAESGPVPADQRVVSTEPPAPAPPLDTDSD